MAVVAFILIIAVVVIVFLAKESARLRDDLTSLRSRVGEGDAIVKEAGAKCSSMLANANGQCASLFSDAQKSASRVVDDALRKSNDAIRERMLIADTKIKTREEQYQRLNEEYWKKRDEIEMCVHIKALTYSAMSEFRQDIRKEFGGQSLRYLSDKYVEALISIRDEVWSYIDMIKAPRAEDKLRVEHSKRMRAEKDLVYYGGLVAMYESAVPWIVDLRESALPERVSCLEQTDDEARAWLSLLTDDEWLKLSVTDRNQLALDRYIQSRKSNAEIGRDYEQYIGWTYEKKGWSVQYHGMVKGYDDLGRDLICSKDGVVHVVQCKCWSKLRIIHECHISQLFGTFVKFAMENKCYTKFYDFSNGKRGVEAIPFFITSATLSPVASKFAEALGVSVRENIELGDFPRIKCNIGKECEKIYHLPFDQQYNKTVVDLKGEFYAWRVDEAESQGFRRARKHVSQQVIIP